MLKAMKEAIASVRSFNRFFTRFVGALDNDFLESSMTLAEARILFEIAQREASLGASSMINAHSRAAAWSPLVIMLVVVTVDMVTRGDHAATRFFQ